MTPCYRPKGAPTEVAISCVIPACLNTHTPAPQLQNKPGKSAVEEAQRCVPDGKPLGLSVALGGGREEGSSAPPPHLVAAEPLLTGCPVPKTPLAQTIPGSLQEETS